MFDRRMIVPDQRASVVSASPVTRTIDQPSISRAPRLL
jgi:hypothetical protein